MFIRCRGGGLLNAGREGVDAATGAVVSITVAGGTVGIRVGVIVE